MSVKKMDELIYLSGGGVGGESVRHPFRRVRAHRLALAQFAGARGAPLRARRGGRRASRGHAHHALDVLADPTESSNVS